MLEAEAEEVTGFRGDSFGQLVLGPFAGGDLEDGRHGLKLVPRGVARQHLHCGASQAPTRTNKEKSAGMALNWLSGDIKIN